MIEKVYDQHQLIVIGIKAFFFLHFEKKTFFFSETDFPSIS